MSPDGSKRIVNVEAGPNFAEPGAPPSTFHRERERRRERDAEYIRKIVRSVRAILLKTQHMMQHATLY